MKADNLAVIIKTAAAKFAVMVRVTQVKATTSVIPLKLLAALVGHSSNEILFKENGIVERIS